MNIHRRRGWTWVEGGRKWMWVGGGGWLLMGVEGGYG